MGIFDKLTGGKDVHLTPKSALALAAMTMIAVDGVVEDEEIDALKRIVRGDGNALDQAYKLYKDKSIQECVQLVNEALDEKQKKAVIINLLDIAMADGILVGAEKELMMLYLNSFQTSEEVIKDIVDIIAIKNDFSVFE